jgi:hypothetical protein
MGDSKSEGSFLFAVYRLLCLLLMEEFGYE